jgi:GNAT superfamily N-acetyltransferase
MRLGRRTVPEEVERENRPPGIFEEIDEAGAPPVVVEGRGESVSEEDRGRRTGHDRTVAVRRVDASGTYQLRSHVLRDGEPHDGFDIDDLPGTFHLAALLEADGHEVIVGVATFVPGDRGWWQLRGMAVEPRHQGSGVGRRLLAEAELELRAAGGAGVWANARDTALGFYEREGWVVVGAGYEVVGLPHHRVERHFDA